MVEDWNSSRLRFVIKWAQTEQAGYPLNANITTREKN